MSNTTNKNDMYIYQFKLDYKNNDKERQAYEIIKNKTGKGNPLSLKGFLIDLILNQEHTTTELSSTVSTVEDTLNISTVLESLKQDMINEISNAKMELSKQIQGMPVRTSTVQSSLPTTTDNSDEVVELIRETNANLGIVKEQISDIAMGLNQSITDSRQMVIGSINKSSDTIITHTDKTKLELLDSMQTLKSEPVYNNPSIPMYNMQMQPSMNQQIMANMNMMNQAMQPYQGQPHVSQSPVPEQVSVTKTEQELEYDSIEVNDNFLSNYDDENDEY